MRLINSYFLPCALVLLLTANSADARTYTVDNPSLADHGDASITGTIAEALISCAQDGGGVVQISAGIYVTTRGLRLGRNCSLAGSGMDATTRSTTTRRHGELLAERLPLRDLEVGI